MARRFGWCVLIVVVFLCPGVFAAGISCRNEAGEPVDWFVIYKLPKYKIGELGSGLDYMYLDASGGAWRMSQYLVNNSEGALGRTLGQLYLGQAYQSNRSFYALYNDAPPELDYLRGYGHTKGVLLSDHSQGFWLSHSVPRFPAFPERGYGYPRSGEANGQTALCVTFSYEQVRRLGQQLAFLYPRFYNCCVPASFSADLPQLSQMCGGSRPPLTSDRRAETLLSARGETFVSFAKSERFVDDIYAGWAAQELRADLLVQSWRRKGPALPSNCSLPQHALNIQRIGPPGAARFWSRYDHSKWCVAWASTHRLTCLGDLNRARAQMWRGGGLVCSFSPRMYAAFRQLVDWYSGCEDAPSG